MLSLQTLPGSQVLLSAQAVPSAFGGVQPFSATSATSAPTASKQHVTFVRTIMTHDLLQRILRAVVARKTHATLLSPTFVRAFCLAESPSSVNEHTASNWPRPVP